ncbi:MAG: Essential protein Yae1, terminal, partial [Dehalococcoidia bacterium]|nr:Essential protein Yae1, terminal [Dehalococcoidia bacterium]
RRVLIVFIAAVAVLALAGCSGARDEAYKKGYDAGFAEGGAQKFAEGREKGLAEGRQQGLDEGKQQGLAEGRSSLDSLVRAAYDRGYQEGVAAGSKTPTPAPLVKVLSYTIAGNTVVGELQNLSDRGLDVILTGALLDARGNVMVTNASLWRGYVQAQEKVLFTLIFPAPGGAPADARINVIWQ